MPLKAAIVDQVTKGLAPDATFPNVIVAVPVAAQRRVAVIDEMLSGAPTRFDC